MLKRHPAVFFVACCLTACGAEGGSQGVPTTASTTTTSSGGDGGGGQSATSGTGGQGGQNEQGGGGQGGQNEPPFDAIAWETGDEVGYGVARKDSENHQGDSIFVGYGGFGATLEATEAWVTALYEASLKAHGVRYVYAVQGPADVYYAGKEIGNSKIVANLLTQLGGADPFVLVVGHSSGTYVAHELLGQLQGGLDPSGLTDQKVVYFNLDGANGGLTQPIVDRLRNAYFVAAYDSTTLTTSPNYATATATGALYAQKGGYLEIEAKDAGCAAGAVWCLHMVPIITLPHNALAATIPPDYDDFQGRPVTTSYIEDKAQEAGL